MKRINLDLIQTPSPCFVGWDSMTGNNRERFCKQCNHTVHNLSAMTRKNAEALIGKSNGRLCARYIRRADGSIVTADLTLNRRRMSGAGLRLAAGAFGLLLAAGSNGFAQTTQSPPKSKIEIRTYRPGQQPSQGNEVVIVSGTVFDPYGAVVVGAKISVKMDSSGKTLSAVSNDEGRFIISSVLPDAYTITIEARGFRVFTNHDVKITTESRVQLSVTLEIDTTPAEVTVTRDVPSATLGILEIDNSRNNIWRRTLNVVTYPYREGKKLLKP